MDQNLYQAIFKRKSFHLFRNLVEEHLNEEDILDIENAFKSFKSLNEDIKVAIRIVPEKETTCRRGGEYCVLLYSEKKDGYLQNIGYLGEQLDLYLVNKNIGTLWFGIGRVKEKTYNDLDYVIMFCIRKISDETKYRKDMYKSKRFPLNEIWNGGTIEGVSNVVRFAPSACNSQPWLVKKEDIKLEIYRYKKPGRVGIMPSFLVGYYNRIDIGIFMCFLELCLEHEHYEFEKELFSDSGETKGMILNATYKLKKS